MRLLHTTTLEFEEFYDHEIPQYGILSHRWSTVEREVSYIEFKTGVKTSTSGYIKILRFCNLARQRNLDYCWIDTCCIDKTSSAELSEAINSMFVWYQRSTICFAYLHDVSNESDIPFSGWFDRGWTLQELIAPTILIFVNDQWQPIGTREELSRPISLESGIDEALLARQTHLSGYSVAQIMSWASRRSTSRIEDEAYCLLGLFGVNMPLLYGEGVGAFRRLQEEILSRGEDYSLFAWNNLRIESSMVTEHSSILAPSPKVFQECNDIRKGFATQRIQFQVTSRGMMLLIHRSLDQETVDRLLHFADDLAYPSSHQPSFQLGLTIPLSCFRVTRQPTSNEEQAEDIRLQLVLDRGK